MRLWIVAFRVPPGPGQTSARLYRYVAMAESEKNAIETARELWMPRSVEGTASETFHGSVKLGVSSTHATAKEKKDARAAEKALQKEMDVEFHRGEKKK